MNKKTIILFTVLIDVLGIGIIIPVLSLYLTGGFQFNFFMISQVMVGWCSLAPREHFPALARSRVLQPVDDQPCWSVSCLFVHRDYRNQGVATLLLGAAIDHVKDKGVRFLEGYPVEPWVNKPIPAAFAWTGIPKAFMANGFVEVARRSPLRPIMRYDFHRRSGR
jgi:GNAT superfamily N-acetyltransferase